MGFTVPAIVNLIKTGYETNDMVRLDTQESSVTCNLTTAKIDGCEHSDSSKPLDMNTELGVFTATGAIDLLKTATCAHEFSI